MLVNKQLLKQILKNRVFVGLLFLLVILTSLSFFFVQFSIDGNLQWLSQLTYLDDNQVLYQSALNSNSTLAIIFLAALIGLTSFVYVMFFYRFFQANRKQMGCLKAMGFRDAKLRRFFIIFVFVFSFIGSVLGLIGGYFLSAILTTANASTYDVSGLVQGISLQSLGVGIIIPIVAFVVLTYFCYLFVGGKEPGSLLFADKNSNRFSIGLIFADKLSKLIPLKEKLKLRIIFRKPLSLLLIIVAVMSFSVCMIMGQSLNGSSQKVLESQLDGYNFDYDVRFSEMVEGAEVSNDSLAYIHEAGIVQFAETALEYNIIGLYDANNLFELHDEKEKMIEFPESGEVIIGEALVEIYGVNVGDTLMVQVDDEVISTKVGAIASNAASASIYMNILDIVQITGIDATSYNGLFLSQTGFKDMENVITPDRSIQSKAEYIETLERNAVSNKVSAVINQVISIVVGCILMFLAVYLNFQDNTHDILILHMMGNKPKMIKKLLIDIYAPVVVISFIITLLPSVYLASMIQRSLSISTNDYMPFVFNGFTIGISFVILMVIYWLVQSIFVIGIKRVIAKNEITELIYAE